MQKRLFAIGLVRRLAKHCESQLQGFEESNFSEAVPLKTMRRPLEEICAPFDQAPLWELSDVALSIEIADLRHQAMLISLQLEVEPKFAVHAFYALRDGCRLFLQRIDAADAK